MKKRIFEVLFFVIVAAMSLGAPLYAEDAKEMGMMGTASGENKGMMGGKMVGMPMMMKMMTDKSVVATSDGGIVVVAGNKITKYDKNLNVIKEAEIKMDMEAMGKQMKEMMEKCPMMKEMKSKEEATPEQPAASSETIEVDEHASHH